MSEVDNKVKMIVEGLLLAAGRPLSLDNISQVFSDEDEPPEKKELRTVLEAIAESCDDRGFELIEVSSGYRFQVKQELGDWVAKLWDEKPPRYTRALLETLALIAYRQPITRGDIEEIRGVGVSANIIRTLLDREWVRVVGHRDVPGRPAMFATTKQFLDYFNLKNLDELPPLADVKELDKVDESLKNNEDMASNQRVIDLPEEAMDEASYEPTEAEKAEMLAEEEAIELSKKPLDEILNLPTAEAAELDESEFDDDLASDSDDGLDVSQLADAADAFSEHATDSDSDSDSDSAAQSVDESEPESESETATEAQLAEVIPITTQINADDTAQESDADFGGESEDELVEKPNAEPDYNEAEEEDELAATDAGYSDSESDSDSESESDPDPDSQEQDSAEFESAVDSGDSEFSDEDGQSLADDFDATEDDDRESER